MSVKEDSVNLYSRKKDDNKLNFIQDFNGTRKYFFCRKYTMSITKTH